MKKESGFTLIEIIVSLILVGIMASVAGMGIVAGVQGYLFAKDNAAISGKAQLAMSRLNRTFMEVLDITTVGSSPTRVTYNRLSGGVSTTETLYLNTADNTVKIASGGSATGGNTLVDHVNSLTLTYQQGAANWVQGTDDFSLLSTVGVTLILTRPDGGNNVTFSSVITPRNNANRGGSTSTTLPNPSAGCFVATAAFGQPDHPMVLLLREFRDRYLLTWAGGRMMVRIYYAVGPYLADLIRDRDWACTLTQWVLLPFAGTAFLMLYAPQAIPFILLLSWIAVTVFFKLIRRRQKMVASVPMNQRGTILLGLIGTMVIFSVLGAAMLSFTNSSIFNQLTSTGSTRAYYLAEGGMRYAGSQFKNAGTGEDVKDVMLESLNGHDFSMGGDGMFHLDAYPYYFKTTAIPSGTTISAKFPGAAPLSPYSLPTSGYLKIGTDKTPRPYTGRTLTGSNITFTMSPALAVGAYTATVNNVLPVGLASSTTLTKGGDLTLSSGAGAFPLVNGTFTIGTATSTTGTNPAVFAYKTRSGNVLQNVTLSQTPTAAFSVSVPANAYISLMKFVNVHSTGTYTPLQASRTISYSIPIGFVSATGTGGKSAKTDTFETLDNWFTGTGEVGSHAIAAVDGNNALDITGTENVYLLSAWYQRKSLLTLNWSALGVDLNQSWSLADYLLSYDTQVKIRANGQSYYMAGIIFRVDSSGQMYGVSYLRANTGTILGFDRDTVPDELCPLNKTAMIVLWQETPASNVKWLAYKTLTTADGVVNSSGQLVDWSTLVVRLIEADSLSFDQGAGATLRYGDVITGATSGAKATINGTPILTSGAWGSNATGWLTVSNVTKTGGVIQFQSGENLLVEGTVRAHYTGNSRLKDNYIRVYYGNTSNLGTANANPLDNNRLANARLAPSGEVTWPKDDVADWAAANDYFTLVQWDNTLNLDAGDTRLGTGSELNAIIRTNALTTPSSGTFAQVELGLDTWGATSTSVYFDDFGLQTAAPGQTQGFLPAIQQ
jgi:prepilin-type N-terminal cleavage/methylation domain-containing protein